MSPTIIATTGGSTNAQSVAILLQGRGFTGSDVVKLVEVQAASASCATGVASNSIQVFTFSGNVSSGIGALSASGAFTVVPTVRCSA